MAILKILVLEWLFSAVATQSVFTNLPARLAIPESSEPGSQIYEVRLGQSAEFLYSFDFRFSTGAAENFQVRSNHDNGYKYNVFVSPNSTLDFESLPNEFNITFLANPNLEHRRSVDSDRTMTNAENSNRDGTEYILSIALTDVNEKPSFSKSIYYVTTSEMSQAVTIPDFEVFDEDAKDNLFVYDIIAVHPNATYGLWRNELSDRRIRLPLNYDVDENNQSELVLLTVKAVDKGSLSSTSLIVVDISDVNDNRPKFNFENPVVHINRDLPLGSIILNMTAQDRDSRENGRIEYGLLNSQLSDHFAVNRSSGGIRIVKSLASMNEIVVNLSVTATDHGTPALISRTILSVIVDTCTRSDVTGGNSGGNIDSMTRDQVCDMCGSMYMDGVCRQNNPPMKNTKTATCDVSYLKWLIPVLFVTSAAAIIGTQMACQYLKKNKTSPDIQSDKMAPFKVMTERTMTELKPVSSFRPISTTKKPMSSFPALSTDGRQMTSLPPLSTDCKVNSSESFQRTMPDDKEIASLF